MARRVIGLDVGTYSVKVAHLEARTRGAGYDVHEYKEIPLSRFAKEGEENSEEDLQKAALLELKRLNIADGSWVISGLSSNQSQIRSLDVPFADAKKIEAVLPGLMDSHLPFSVENLVYTWFPVAEKPNSSHLLVGFARKEAVVEKLAQLKAADIDPRILTVKAAALYELIVQAPPQGDEGTLFAVVDIGHKSTGICVGSRSSMRFARSVPKGGWHVTQTLAQKLNLSFEEAEVQKHDTKTMNELLQEGYYPIAREIRQTILAMESETERKVEEIYLVGGGAKAAGLPSFLSSLLGTRVSLVDRMSFGHVGVTEPAVRNPPGSEGALAVSYALLGEQAARRIMRFNFRKGEFSFSGELGFLRQRAVALSVFAVVLLVLLGFTAWLRSSLLEKDLQALTQKLEQTCPAQRPASAKPEETGAKACLSWMKTEIKAQQDYRSFIPEDGAADVFIALSSVIPNRVDIKFKALSIDAKKITFSAESQDPGVADQLTAAFDKSPCFSDVVKKRNVLGGNNVNIIDMEMKYNCDTNKEAPVNDKASKEKA